MPYLIDGNNLSYALARLSKNDNFIPEKNCNFVDDLVDILEKFNQKKKQRIFLVLDSPNGFMDQYKRNLIKIIYVPRNEAYSSADDKIVEILFNFKNKRGYSFTLVSDDQELCQRARNILKNDRLFIKSAFHFAKQLLFYFPQKEDDFDDNQWKDDLTEELLKIWGNK